MGFNPNDYDFAGYATIPDMRYVEYLGSKWTIKSVEPKDRKLILTIGGVYNGG